MSELIEIEEKELQQTPVNTQMSQPDRLLEMAISNGANMEQLEKLLDLQERYNKEEARKAFTKAMALFKSESPEIKKDRIVTIETKDSGTYGYTHASIGNVVNAAVQIMAKYGLSHKWEIKQADARIKVTCVVTHEDGHSESVSLDGGPDTSGKKNGIQQVSSTVTYLERYTFLAITGLAVNEMDDDGIGAGKKVELITEEQEKELHSQITENELNMEIFLKWAKVEKISDIKACNFGKMKSGIKKSIEAKNNDNP